MRCLKCGAFVEDGRKICFMCGASIDSNQQPNFDNLNNSANAGNDIIQSTLNESLNSSIGNSMDNSNVGGFGPMDPGNQGQMAGGFGAGAFGGGAGFSNGASQIPSPMNTVVQEQKGNKKKNKELKPHEEQDIFDFYEKHKTGIRILLFFGIVGLLSFIGYKVYQKALEPDEKIAKIHELYFEISDDFVQNSNSREKLSYAKSGSMGTECHVEITLGTDSGEDHASTFQGNVVTKLTPERDDEGKPKDPLKEFTTQTNSLTINAHQWHYMNIFYRKNTSSEYTVLKYQLMTAMKNGYFYDIILTNNSGTSSCSTSLDNFIKSLEFVDVVK